MLKFDGKSDFVYKHKCMVPKCKSKVYFLRVLSTYNRFQKENPPKNNRSSFLVKFAATIPLP